MSSQDTQFMIYFKKNILIQTNYSKIILKIFFLELKKVLYLHPHSGNT